MMEVPDVPYLRVWSSAHRHACFWHFRTIPSYFLSPPSLNSLRGTRIIPLPRPAFATYATPSLRARKKEKERRRRKKEEHVDRRQYRLRAWLATPGDLSARTPLSPHQPTRMRTAIKRRATLMTNCARERERRRMALAAKRCFMNNPKPLPDRNSG